MLGGSGEFSKKFYPCEESMLSRQIQQVKTRKRSGGCSKSIACVLLICICSTNHHLHVVVFVFKEMFTWYRIFVALRLNFSNADLLYNRHNYS